MIWYHIIWYPMISSDTISYDIRWYHIIWYHIIWYDITSYDMISYDIISYDIIWYHIIWHHIIWHHVPCVWKKLHFWPPNVFGTCTWTFPQSISYLIISCHIRSHDITCFSPHNAHANVAHRGRWLPERTPGKGKNADLAPIRASEGTRKMLRGVGQR